MYAVWFTFMCLKMPIFPTMSCQMETTIRMNEAFAVAPCAEDVLRCERGETELESILKGKLVHTVAQHSSLPTFLPSFLSLRV